MSYMESITTAFIAFPFIAFLFTIPFILYNYHKYGSIHIFRVFIVYTFILYLINIYFLVILPLPTFEEALQNTGPYINYIPFSFVKDFILETPFVWNDPSTYLKAILDPSFYVVAFNILMFVPLGMYLRYYFKCSFKKTLLYSFFVSLFFELTQLTGLYFIYPNPYRLCDVDDLIQNTLGGILGFLIMGAIIRFLPTREKIDEEALEMGKKVSGLRRITVFFLDLFLFLILSVFVSIFLEKYVFFVSFGIYYVLIPLIYHNATIGMKFLNLKMEYKRVAVLFNILRYLFLFLYYFVLPWGFVLFLIYVHSQFNLQNITFLLYGSGFLFILLFYLIHFILLLKNKKMFYDRLFGFRFLSTIEEQEV
ncbi:putative uncharacterized protein [Mycoplasma sp. CAG:776]|nr:putative uncharacterized protein [Mycoplasma sp. CAG:776]